MKRRSVLALFVAAFAACGGNTLQSESDDAGDSSDAGALDSAPIDGTTGLVDANGSPDVGADGYASDAPYSDLDASTPDASTPDADAVDASIYVDAGYYTGDGSYWVDGGAYPPPPDASRGDDATAGTDSGAIDAAAGCGALAACCASLSGGAQSLCDSVAASSDATNCAAELAQLEGEGSCAGVTVLATQVQQPATRMASDGTTLFWTTFEGAPGLFAMPVGGGPVTILVGGETGGDPSFLAVDDVNVYVIEGTSLIRIPKNGAPPTLINDPGAIVGAATSLEGVAYWTESVPQSNGTISSAIVVNSAPLAGGPITQLANFVPSYPDVDQIAVTASAVFLGMSGSSVSSFSRSTLPASGATPVADTECDSLASDTSAVYCAQRTGSNEAIASGGPTTPLGAAANTAYMVADETYVYWVDNTTVGTIMKAPKSGAGGAVALANDTNPTAIAVDASSVYWSDAQGYIKSVPK